MKNPIIPALFLSFLLLACEKGKDISGMNVPSVVVNELKTQFPEMTDLEWKTFKSRYQAEFEVNNIDHQAVIDEKGKLLKYKFERPASDLPEEIKQYIRQKYPDKPVEDMEVLKIGDHIFYQVEFENWLRDEHKIFLPSGEENSTMKPWID